MKPMLTPIVALTIAFACYTNAYLQADPAPPPPNTQKRTVNWEFLWNFGTLSQEQRDELEEIGPVLFTQILVNSRINDPSVTVMTASVYAQTYPNNSYTITTGLPITVAHVQGEFPYGWDSLVMGGDWYGESSNWAFDIQWNGHQQNNHPTAGVTVPTHKIILNATASEL